MENNKINNDEGYEIYQFSHFIKFQIVIYNNDDEQIADSTSKIKLVIYRNRDIRIQYLSQ